MTLTERDKRALVLLAVALVAYFIFWLATREDTQVVVASPQPPVAVLEQRLERARRAAAQLPALERQRTQAQQALQQQERVLIQAQTAQQAQARLLEIVRAVASRQSPPLEIKAVELDSIPQPRQGSPYGQVLVSLTVDCTIDQLVNFLAELANQPQAVATDLIRITGADRETKQLRVRLRLAGLVPAGLFPARRSS